MKQIIILLSIITGVIIANPAQAQEVKGMDQFEVQVDGLGCPFCAYGLEKKFKEFKGIKKIAIDIETGDFSFLYPSNKQLTMDTVLAQVVKAGYTPNEATITRANGQVETNVTTTDDIAATDLTTRKIFVNGQCGMCKARIEKTVTGLSGVSTAVWSVDDKMLEVSYDTKTTDVTAIEKATASIGHDTKSIKASDESYESLHPCCHYKREQ